MRWAQEPYFNYDENTPDNLTKLCSRCISIGGFKTEPLETPEPIDQKQVDMLKQNIGLAGFDEQGRPY